VGGVAKRMLRHAVQHAILFSRPPPRSYEVIDPSDAVELNAMAVDSLGGLPAPVGGDSKTLTTDSQSEEDDDVAAFFANIAAALTGASKAKTGNAANAIGNVRKQIYSQSNSPGKPSHDACCPRKSPPRTAVKQKMSKSTLRRRSHRRVRKSSKGSISAGRVSNERNAHVSKSPPRAEEFICFESESDTTESSGDVQKITVSDSSKPLSFSGGETNGVQDFIASLERELLGLPDCGDTWDTEMQ